MNATVNDLELELRKLPGVHAAGFSEQDDCMFVQVHTEPSSTEPGLALAVTRLASRHSEHPVAVEVVRWHAQTPREDAGSVDDLEEASSAEGTVDLTAAESAGEATEREARVKLIAVLGFPDTDEVEVHLTFGGKRTIGRAVASRGLIAAVDATLDALSELVADFAYVPVWAREVDPADRAEHLVAVGLVRGRHQFHGIAAGNTDIEAAARATLDALNRTVGPELASNT